MKRVKGRPLPLGASKTAGGFNFAVYSKVELKCLLVARYNHRDEITEIPLDCTGNIWHVALKTDQEALYYGYETVSGVRLVDPYAHLLNAGNVFGKNRYKSDALMGIAYQDTSFSWDDVETPCHDRSDLVIYEMHVRGFTEDASSAVAHPGTYLGLIEKIPYLKELGVNAIELLPVAEFDELESLYKNPITKKRLYNYWGYSPLNFFAPMQRYAVSADPIEAAREFKAMVKACHQEGIEVILDVVFNHTGEGNEEGRVFSWKGFAENDYYIKDEKGHFANYTGCGNTLNCNHPIVSDMIIASLRHWMLEFHVDGFRFDLASIMMRDQDGKILQSSPLVERISQDALLSHSKLIAEPWDASGLHQVGSFYQSSWCGPEQWMEWNDDFRTVVRRFIKGTPGYVGRFATKLCGSEDVYGKGGSPMNSVNFITCHDGFTLRDLVSYNMKHNIANGENNRDGMDNNDSWNCGHEGPTSDPQITFLRERQLKNFWLALMVSSGLPMILMGDEYGRSKGGNNNTWGHDDLLNWFSWDTLESEKSYVAFCKKLLHFRKSNPLLARHTFFKKEEIDWCGTDWSNESQSLAFRIIDAHDGKDLFIAFHAHPKTRDITLPKLPKGKRWHTIVNTSLKENAPKGSVGDHITLMGFSSLLLVAERF